jgi:phage-related baseplate assembly protein
MAASPNLIDLSALPVPDAVLIPDPSTIFANWLEKLRQLDTIYDALVESDPVYKQGEANAYQTVLLLQRMNDAVRGVLLASALGDDLDQVGAGFNVARLLIIPAQPDAVPPIEAVYEDDEAYRARIQLSWSQLSTAGARGAYLFFAKSADPDVLDAAAYGPKTHGRKGEVDVYVLSRTGNGTAPQSLLDIVDKTLSEDEVRPLTDYVSVKSALLSPFTVEAELEIPDGPDAQTVLDNAKAMLDSYLTQIHRIGAVVPLSGVYRSLHQSGVTRVHLHKPTADLEAVTGTAPYCSSANVTRYGDSDA